MSSYWTKCTTHWKSQLKRHEKAYGVIVVAGATLINPVLGGGVAGAYKLSESANALKRAKRARIAAEQQAAQNPAQFAADVRQPSVGVAGEVEFTAGMKKYLPLALVFVIVGYLIFKD